MTETVKFLGSMIGAMAVLPTEVAQTRLSRSVMEHQVRDFSKKLLDMLDAGTIASLVDVGNTANCVAHPQVTRECFGTVFEEANEEVQQKILAHRALTEAAFWYVKMTIGELRD